MWKTYSLTVTEGQSGNDTCNASNQTHYTIVISDTPGGSERKLPTSIKEELTHHQLAQFGVRRYAPLFRGGREMQIDNAKIP